MRKQWIAYLGVAMLAGAVGGALLSPAPAGAVAREIVELQQSVNQLIQGQQTLQTTITQNDAIQKTLIEQSADSVNKLSTTMLAVEKSMQDLQANSGARLDTMATQIQGISDNLQEAQARLGKLNQQLTDAQTAIQGIDAKLAASAPAQPGAPSDPGAPSGALAPGAPPVPGAGAAPGPASAAVPASAPSSDLLYTNALRDYNSHKFELASQEFHDYLKYYGQTDLAANAQFYIGEMYYAQKQYDLAVDAYDKVLENYPKGFNSKMAPARLKKGMALSLLGDKLSAIRELRAVVKMYPGTDEERIARTKLKELGVAA